jgi:adenine deaminase
MEFTINGRLVDVYQEKIYPAIVTIKDERISAISPIENELSTSETDNLPYILPGFIDAHVHIESSMLIPSEFARLAVVHGTVSTISDPHEIANVCGINGVEYMIDNGKKVPFKFYFGAPSCVPATHFETAGAEINAKDIDQLMKRSDIFYLCEMMNFPGVLNKDPEVMEKIAIAKKYNKPVDGHAPGLKGETAKQYINAGISTDHECFTREEALDKLKCGMKILIREGSAAKNFEALIDLLNDFPDQIMFCSDDKHPDSLVEGHINQLCARAAAKGINIFKIIKAASVNPVEHYKLKTGLLRRNDYADFVLVKDLIAFQVIDTYINGKQVCKDGKTQIKSISNLTAPINNFKAAKKQANDFVFSTSNKKNIEVIEALDGQLITNKIAISPKTLNNEIVSDPDNDIVKIVVVNRYQVAPVAVAFIKNTGLKNGAIASSVAHDSHNIVAIGITDEDICHSVNMLIEAKGGVSCYGTSSNTGNKIELLLPLPVAGLMSREDGYEVAKQYSEIDKSAKSFGSTLSSPYMTLSFMALLVIPHLKLSDKGLFDGDSFTFIEYTD